MDSLDETSERKERALCDNTNVSEKKKDHEMKRPSAQKLTEETVQHILILSVLFPGPPSFCPHLPILPVSRRPSAPASPCAIVRSPFFAAYSISCMHGTASSVSAEYGRQHQEKRESETREGGRGCQSASLLCKRPKVHSLPVHASSMADASRLVLCVCVLGWHVVQQNLRTGNKFQYLGERREGRGAEISKREADCFSFFAASS